MHRPSEREGLVVNASDGCLVDQTWYRQTYPGVEKKVDPVCHYVDKGAAEGRSPNPYLDTRWYVETFSNVREAEADPLLHYLTDGIAKGAPQAYHSTRPITSPRVPTSP